MSQYSDFGLTLCLLTFSVFSSQAGAIFATHSASLHLAGTTFSHNQAFIGGALVCQGNTISHVANSTFESNSASAIVAQGEASLTLLNSHVHNNSAPMQMGGAVWMQDGSKLTMTQSVLSGNRALIGGGLSANGDSHSTITLGVFENNTASSGGAVAVSGSSFINCTDSLFANNQATTTGAAVSITEHGYGALKASTFTGNNAGQEGAGVYVQRTPLFASTSLQNLSVSDLTFTDNKAVVGPRASFFEATYERSA